MCLNFVPVAHGGLLGCSRGSSVVDSVNCLCVELAVIFPLSLCVPVHVGIYDTFGSIPVIAVTVVASDIRVCKVSRAKIVTANGILSLIEG